MLLRSGIVAAASKSAAWYIRPSSHGNGSGSNWANAGTIAQLPGFLGALLPGGTIRIAADDGAYTIDSSVNSLVLSRSAGDGAAAITGENMDGTTGKAVINSTRVPWSTTNYAVGTPENGYDVFRIADGATGLSFSNFSFTNVGNAIIFLANASSISITDCDATNSYCLVQAERDVNGTSVAKNQYSLPDLTLARLTSTGYEMGLFLSYATMTGFSATDITGDAQSNYGTSFMEGFHLGGTVTNPIVTNLRCDNSAYPNRGSVYWNGDGFVTESGTSGGVWSNVGGNGNDDGGLDTKDEGGTYNNCVSSRNKKNYKHWGSTGTHNDCHSTNPVKNGGTDIPNHFLFAGSTDGTWTMNRPVIRSDVGTHDTLGNTAAVFRNERSGGSVINLTVNDWDIVVDPDSAIFGGTFNFTASPAFPTVDTFALTWASGAEQGVIDQGTSVGGTIATLSATGTNNTGSGIVYRIKPQSDADGKFQISGSNLQLAAALDPSVKTTHTCTIQAYDPSGLAKGTDIAVTIYVNATTLDSDTQAWYDALGTASLAQPSRRWRSAYDNLVRGLKAIDSGSYWSGVDGFIPLISYDAGVAKRNLKQNNYHATFTGTTDWAAKRSWKGNGTDAKIDIPFNPATAGGNCQQNANHFLIDVLTTVDETVVDFSVDTTTRTFIRSLLSGNKAYNNTSSASSQSSSGGGTALYGMCRTVSTSFRYFRDTGASSASKTSTTFTSANLVAGANSAQGSIFTTREYGLLGWGGAFANDSTTFQAIRTAWLQFKAQAVIAE